MIRLLYVDANLERCEVIAAFCKRAGPIVVDTCNSGEAALEWLSFFSADVIVSGCDFPGGVHGIALLGKLRARCNTTPFILFTAGDSPAIRKEAYRNGAFSIIRNTHPLGKNTVYCLIRTIFWAVMYEGNRKNSNEEQFKKILPGEETIHETSDS